MLAQERYEQILNMLAADNSVKVSNLTKLFDVSIETVRRDLEYLESEGLLKRVYGGAVLEKINGKQVSLKKREKEHIEEKRKIAQIASRFINEGQSIALDSGTTTLEITKILKQKFKNITVLTNSLLIANELSDVDGYTIILPGGRVKNNEFCLIGSIAEKNITQFHIDTAFISVSGISLKEGATDFDFDEIPIQKKLINISEQIVLLADSSKFDVVSLVKVCDLDKVSVIVTDSKLKPNILKKYIDNSIEVINH